MGVIAHTPAPPPLKADAFCPQDAADLVARHVQLIGQRLSVPLGLALGRGFLQLRQNRLPCLDWVICRRFAAPGGAEEPSVPVSMCRRLHLPAVGSEIPSSLAVAVSVTPSLAIIIILVPSTSLASAVRLEAHLLMVLNSSALHMAMSPLRGVWSAPNATDYTIYNKLLQLRTRSGARMITKMLD